MIRTSVAAFAALLFLTSTAIAQDKVIKSAMSAGPPSISADATIMDWEMNVVREGKDETEMGREVEFLRGRRYDQSGRIILPIRFPRSEIIDEKDRLAEMERYVNL